MSIEVEVEARSVQAKRLQRQLGESQCQDLPGIVFSDSSFWFPFRKCILLGTLAALSVFSGCGGSEPPRKEIEEFSRENPGVVIALPVSLPDGYQWAGIGELQGDGERIWAATLQFVSEDGGPLVEICAKPKSQVKGCVSDSDTSMKRSWDQVLVTVTLEEGVGDRNRISLHLHWERVGFTGDVNKIDWAN